MDSLDMFRIPLDEGSRGPCKICETHPIIGSIWFSRAVHISSTHNGRCIISWEHSTTSVRTRFAHAKRPLRSCKLTESKKSALQALILRQETSSASAHTLPNCGHRDHHIWYTRKKLRCWCSCPCRTSRTRYAVALVPCCPAGHASQAELRIWVADGANVIAPEKLLTPEGHSTQPK